MLNFKLQLLSQYFSYQSLSVALFVQAHRPVASIASSRGVFPSVVRPLNDGKTFLSLSLAVILITNYQLCQNLCIVVMYTCFMFHYLFTPGRALRRGGIVVSGHWNTG